jgi:hypothetical protein
MKVQSNHLKIFTFVVLILFGSFSGALGFGLALLKESKNIFAAHTTKQPGITPFVRGTDTRSDNPPSTKSSTPTVTNRIRPTSTPKLYLNVTPLMKSQN